MKVCSVCNEIMAADQGCARSDCPNQIQATTDPAPEVDPGFTGKADRFVQAGLDGAGGVARETTRAAFFILGGVSAAILFAVIFVMNNNKEQTTGAVANEVGTREIPATAQYNASVQATDLRAMSCDELWYARNRIYADKGQCFRTDRAINAFGPRCHPPYGDLSQSEQVRVSEIRSWEQQKGC